MTRRGADSPQDLWVFGYGSLMWKPGFVFADRHKALLRGWRRRLCVYTHVYRGTKERPGLVLGLDWGGACRGVAFRVDAALHEATVRYLRERELVTAVYIERVLPVELGDGRRIQALAYVADRAHGQYAPPMERSALLQLVRQGVGKSGENGEYVLNTRDHLRGLGIVDSELEWLSAQLRAA
ncbi:MAG: gamma-glutamylcyclotransferase [Hyphomicrobiales bacterium]|nr:gamma-glutamylcyclotransferase [Hyphomicrobiales bacterium]